MYPKVAFFTEAGTKRGMGHLIRCYAIHEAFKKCGVSTTFYLDSDVDYSYKYNDLQYFKWTHFNLSNTYDIIFIDSYEADIQIYAIASNSSKVAVFLDDYERISYPRGIIINFAPEAKELFFKNKEIHNTYLLGTDYVPLRESLLLDKPAKKRQIFIMLGGYDINNLSINILEALDNIDIQKILVTNNEEILNKVHRFKNVRVLYKPSDNELIYEMSSSSMAISTASMAVYELNFFQIPTVIIAVSKNQEIGLSQLIKYEIADASINMTEFDWIDKLLRVINIFDETTYNKKQIIDAKGAQRIVNTVLRIVSK